MDSRFSLPYNFVLDRKIVLKTVSIKAKPGQNKENSEVLIYGLFKPYWAFIIKGKWFKSFELFIVMWSPAELKQRAIF